MCSNNAVLPRDEEYVLGLRSLYESYGYKKFKMGKFEKYDLYLENKSFLQNTNIITVTDPAGRLLALKPDITLSIVKNIRAAEIPQKFYYNENIYSAETTSGEIKETTQVGLEYIGELDTRSLGEVLILAAESLANTGENYRIAVSHMGIVSELLDYAALSETDKVRMFELISEKNLHGIRSLCSSLSLSQEITEKIQGLINICGTFGLAISSAESLVCGKLSESSLNELKSLSKIIDEFGLSDKFILDFSVMNDVSYYNGLVFQGFISGVPKSVLSGGQYDKLVQRFGCDTSAVGFAVYTDLLSRFHYRESDYDYEVLLLYSEKCDPAAVLAAQRKFVENGDRCVALSEEPQKQKYLKKVIMSSDGSIKDE